MPNRDPENFVSFSDYMGLNDQAGKDAMARLMASKTGTDADPEKVRANALAHEGMAQEQGYGANTTQSDGNINPSLAGVTDVSGGAYDSTAAAASSGLTAYGDFIKAAGDPQARQAAMAKLYGGNFNALDSDVAGTGGGAQVAAEKANAGDLASFVNRRMEGADNYFKAGQTQRTSDDKWAADDKVRRQQQYDKQQEAAAASEKKRQDDMARSYYVANMESGVGWHEYGKGKTDREDALAAMDAESKRTGKKWVLKTGGTGGSAGGPPAGTKQGEAWGAWE